MYTGIQCLPVPPLEFCSLELSWRLNSSPLLCLHRQSGLEAKLNNYLRILSQEDKSHDKYLVTGPSMRAPRTQSARPLTLGNVGWRGKGGNSNIHSKSYFHLIGKTNETQNSERLIFSWWVWGQATWIIQGLQKSTFLPPKQQTLPSRLEKSKLWTSPAILGFPFALYNKYSQGLTHFVCARVPRVEPSCRPGQEKNPTSNLMAPVPSIQIHSRWHVAWVTPSSCPPRPIYALWSPRYSISETSSPISLESDNPIGMRPTV